MAWKELSPADQVLLKHLRQQVDRRTEDLLSSDPPPNAKNELFYAREELRLFVMRLRKDGCNI